jgi:asparagine synthase (glutamine-hydrolysing)
MCGIAGIIDPQRRLAPPELRDVVTAMAGALIHRGPDDHGVWLSDDGLCALAHRRLAIIDASADGRQPMQDRSGRFVISFNGEIYNFQQLRGELCSRGAHFMTRTDTEVLIEAFAAFGADTYEKLEGMYALAVFDRVDGSLTLARDPFGEKPLYFTTQQGAVAFASELNALHAVPWFAPDVQTEAIAEYLALQYVHGPRSVYHDTFKLEPGTWLRIARDGRATRGRHFSFDPGGGEPCGRIEDRIEELDSAIAAAVRGAMISDFPVGAFLSSGIDSSLVTAMARRVCGHAVRTFSVGFAHSSESEHVESRDIARLLQCDHVEHVLPQEVLSLLPTIAASLDEPNGDPSCLPTYLLCQRARQDVKVAISGDGGDELFGGYQTYSATIPPDDGGSAIAPLSPAGDSFVRRMSAFSRDEIALLLGRRPTEADALLHSLAAEINCQDRPLISRLRRADARTFLPGSVLQKVDRMSMQHSLEVRSPLLNRTIARLAARLTPPEVMADGIGKVVLRKLAGRYLPAASARRAKKGFALPKDWLPPTAIDALAREYLWDSGAQIRRWIEWRTLLRFLGRQQRPETANPSQIWRLLVLELWLQSHPVARQREWEANPIPVTPVAPGTVSLLRLQPERTFEQTAFNVQPDGSSALTVCCTNATPWTSIMMDGEELATTYGDSNTLTAIVPSVHYGRPGTRQVVLMDGEARSNAVTFEVLPHSDAPLVSVVIPCFNQGRFLGDAIRSVINQTHRHVEIVVIDDGSTDETGAVARQFPEVRYVRQHNRGLPRARNRGLAEGTGQFVVFLDADDRLLPHAIEAGLAAIRGEAAIAFAFGHYRSITEHGRALIDSVPEAMGEDAYAAFLRRNLVGTTSAAIFRTAAVRTVGGFSTSPRFRGCEDYALYLELARRFSVMRHMQVVAEYRLHSASMSTNLPRMLASVISILRAQRRWVANDARRRAARREGLDAWRRHYVHRIAIEIMARGSQLPFATVAQWVRLALYAAPAESLRTIMALRRSNAVTFHVGSNATGNSTSAGSTPPLRLHPSSTQPGEPFNLQPCGWSALAIESEEAAEDSVVVFGDTPLWTQYGGGSLVTAFVPPELYARPGCKQVYLLRARHGATRR